MAGERRAVRGAAPTVPLRFVIVTLDAHLAEAFEAARAELRRELPALELSLHVQAEWDASPAALEATRAAIARANVIACVQLFTEEQAGPILDAVRARRADADAVFCALCTSELTKQTRLGKFSMLGDEAQGAIKAFLDSRREAPTPD